MESPTLEQVVSLALQLTLAEQAQLIEQVAAWMARELNVIRTVDPTETESGASKAAPHDSLDSSG
jgi:hypothetical protein